LSTSTVRVLASGQVEPAEVAVDANHIYWATGDTSHVASLHDSDAHDLADRVAEGMAVGG
jgi:hypothetical protein